MFTIDITDTDAVDRIAAITAHLPPYASLGRILVATSNGIVTADAAMWNVSGDGASRLLPLGDDGTEHELTRWCDGVEVDRQIIRTAPDSW